MISEFVSIAAATRCVCTWPMCTQSQDHSGVYVYSYLMYSQSFVVWKWLIFINV